MRAKQALADLKKALAQLYDQREASALGDWVMEDITGKSRMDRIVRDEELIPEQEEKWHSYKKQLVAGKPLQYVLGYAWFMGERFKVNEHVLIPRPETEELVEWLVSEVTSGNSVMDIGTGSGCIPIMIGMLIPGIELSTVDISKDAIAVAEENARLLHVNLKCIEGDFLNKAFREKLPTPEIIISNPPYIPFKDAGTMHKNVVEHEPHQALFVPDEDALVFYRHIIEFARERKVRKIFFETHYQLARAVAEEGIQNGYKTELRKDLAGHERMVKMVIGQRAS